MPDINSLTSPTAHLPTSKPQRDSRQVKRRNIGALMKAAFLTLLIAAIAGVEFHHEWTHSELAGGICLAPESQKVAINDMLIQHLRAH